MKSPTISVCIPVYNVEDYLPRCLDSIINQTFTDFEVIIVNDASPDNSEAIIKSYQKKDSRIRYYKHEKNIGPNATRKTAIDHARGEYLSFVDSDDWVEPTFLAKLYEKATSTQADVTVCNYFIFSKENGKEEKRVALDLNIESNDLFSLHLEKLILAPSFCNKLWKKELFEKPGISFPRNIFFSEDLFVTTKLLYYANGIAIHNESLYHYRVLYKKEQVASTSLLAGYLQNEIFIHNDLAKFFTNKLSQKQIKTFLVERKFTWIYLLSLLIESDPVNARLKFKEIFKNNYFASAIFYINPTVLFYEAKLKLISKKMLPLGLYNKLRSVYAVIRKKI